MESFVVAQAARMTAPAIRFHAPARTSAVRRSAAVRIGARVKSGIVFLLELCSKNRYPPSST
jgi:hypothetical protein